MLLPVAALLAGCIPNQEYQRPETPAPLAAAPDYSAAGNVDDGPPPLELATPRVQPWELRSVTPDARTIAEGSYVVQQGDTLRSIAAAAGAGSEAIARANGLIAPFTVRVGQRLRIPGGRYHLVRPGQTGIAIARAYGVPWSRIVDANALAEPYVLRAGQRIIVPGGDIRPAPAGAGRPPSGRSLQLVIDDIVTGGQPASDEHGKLALPSPAPADVPPLDVPVATPTHLATGFVWPMDGRIVRRFGPGASGERNDGIEIAAPVGTPVRATADGVVAYTGEGVAGLGALIIMRHGDGWTSVYGHASKLLVQRGQSVKRGQTIALSGDSGFADRPELHFELRKGRAPVDPLGKLPPR